MIIAFTGHTYSGKSTVAKLFRELLLEDMGQPDTWSAFSIEKFSQPLRDVLRVITCLGDWDNRKNDPLPEVWKTDLVKNGRDLHKAVGQGMKQFMGDDVWAKAFFARHEGKSIIIDDLRYESEMQLIANYPHVVIKVECPLEIRAHRSQKSVELLAKLDKADQVASMPYEFVVDNSSSTPPDQIQRIIRRLNIRVT